MRLLRINPQIIGAGIIAILGADEGQVLDPSHIGWRRTRERASGKGLLIELQQFLRGDQLALKGLILGLGSIAPVNFLRPGQLGDLIYPLGYIVVQRGEGCDMLSSSGHKCPLAEHIVLIAKDDRWVLPRQLLGIL